MTKKEKIKVYTLGVIGSIFFGLSFMGTKGALEVAEPMQVAAYRWTIAFVVFVVLIIMKVIKIDLKGKPIRHLVILGIVLPCIYSTCEIWGINLTSTAEAAILLALIPVVVVAASIIILKKKVSKSVIFSIILSFAGAGVTVIFASDFAIGGKVIGYVFLILTVLSGAVYSLVVEKIGAQFTPIEITFGMCTMGCIVFNIVGICMGYTTKDFVMVMSNPKAAICIIFMGIICSILCYVINTYVISKISAPLGTTLSVNLITVTGVVTGFLFLGEAVTWYKLTGVMLILVGVVGANLPAILGKNEEILKEKIENEN